MTRNPDVIERDIERTREQLSRTIEAIRVRTDVKRIGEEKLHQRQLELKTRAEQARQAFAGPRPPGLPGATPPWPTKLRKLGDAAVASGWRKAVADAAAEQLGPRVPQVTGQELRAVLGLGFVAMSSLYVVRSLAKSLRYRAPAPVIVAAPRARGAHAANPAKPRTGRRGQGVAPRGRVSRGAPARVGLSAHA